LKNSFSLFAFAFITIILAFISCAEPQEDKSSPLVDSIIQQAARKAKVQADSFQAYVDSMDAADRLDSINSAKDLASDPLPDSIDKISGTVYYNLSYCGGMRPTQDRLDELAKWHTLSNATLVLENNSDKHEIETSSSGKFAGEIPPGNYEVYLKSVPKEIYDISANGCKDCLTKPIATVKVSFKGKNEIRFTFPCPPGLRQ
jgi:hypothetical protein